MFRFPFVLSGFDVAPLSLLSPLVAEVVCREFRGREAITTVGEPCATSFRDGFVLGGEWQQDIRRGTALLCFDLRTHLQPQAQRINHTPRRLRNVMLTKPPRKAMPEILMYFRG